MSGDGPLAGAPGGLGAGWPARIALAVLFLAAPVFAIAAWDGAASPNTLYFGIPVLCAELVVIVMAALDGFRPAGALAALQRRTRLAAGLWFAVALSAAVLAAPWPAKALVHLAITAIHALFGLALWQLFLTRWRGLERAVLLALALGAAAYALVAVAYVYSHQAQLAEVIFMSGAAVSNCRQIAFYGLPLIGVGTGFLVTDAGSKRRALYIALMVIGWFLCFWSGGRAGAGAAVVQLGLIALFCSAETRKRLAGWTVAAIAIAAPLSEVLTPTFRFGIMTILERTSTASDTYTSRRYEIWRDTLQHIVNSPVIGHGEGQFRIFVRPDINHPHNAILQFIYQWGVVGTLAVATVTLPTLLAARRVLADRHTAALPAAATLIGLLAMSMLEGTLFHVYPTMLSIACLAMLAAAVGKARAAA